MERILRSKNEPIKHGYNSVGQFVWSRLQQLDGQSVCLIDAKTDEHLTVSELKSRANSTAMALIKRGINKTDKIAFCGQNSIQNSILRFTTYFMGTTGILFNDLHNEYDMENYMKTVGANIIMCSAKDFIKYEKYFNNNNNSVKLVVIFDGKHDKYHSFDQLLKEERDQTLAKIPYFDIIHEDIAFISHTSGTTGASKILKQSNRMFMNGLMGIRSSVTSHSIVGMLLHLTVTGGNRSLVINIIRGNTVVLIDDFEREVIFKAIEKYRIHTLCAYSNMASNLVMALNDNNYDMSSLKRFNCGPTPVPTHILHTLFDEYGIGFSQVYGMTEFSPITIGCDVKERYILGNVGQVSQGTEVRIVDLTTGKSLGAGIDGEIYIRGDKMFSGYFNNDGANEEAFDDEGWFRTGDIGHYDHKERLFLTSRLKNIINVYVDNQYNRVFPEEIEDFLSSHKSIAEVVVIGVNNRNGYQWPRAYVVVKDGQTVGAEDIQNFVSESLSSDKQLKAGVVFVEDIHRRSGRKIDRKYYINLVKDVIIE